MTGPDRLATQYGRTLAVMTYKSSAAVHGADHFKSRDQFRCRINPSLFIFLLLKKAHYLAYLTQVTSSVLLSSGKWAWHNHRSLSRSSKVTIALICNFIAPYRLTVLAQSYSSNIPITKTTYNNLPKRSATSNKILKNISTYSNCLLPSSI